MQNKRKRDEGSTERITCARATNFKQNQNHLLPTLNRFYFVDEKEKKQNSVQYHIPKIFIDNQYFCFCQRKIKSKHVYGLANWVSSKICTQSVENFTLQNVFNSKCLWSIYIAFFLCPASKFFAPTYTPLNKKNCSIIITKLISKVWIFEIWNMNLIGTIKQKLAKLQFMIVT